jgi:hypothetical protein
MSNIKKVFWKPEEKYRRVCKWAPFHKCTIPFREGE